MPPPTEYDRMCWCVLKYNVFTAYVFSLNVVSIFNTLLIIETKLICLARVQEIETYVDTMNIINHNVKKFLSNVGFYTLT